MDQTPLKIEQTIFEKTGRTFFTKTYDGPQVTGKRPRSDVETYDGNHSTKFQRHDTAMQPIMTSNEKFTISPFREMVVHLHPYLERRDVIKMAYLIELSQNFEDEMGSSRDPVLFFIEKAATAGKVTPENVDLLVDVLMILNKPEDVVKLVTDFKERALQSSNSDTIVWKKAVLQSDAEQKTSEKDYTRYWLKFKDWCSRQNILEAEKASCKIVLEYLNSLTSSLKLPSIMNYYRAILQYHQEFKFNDKSRLEKCIKDIREQEKKTKN